MNKKRNKERLKVSSMRKADFIRRKLNKITKGNNKLRDRAIFHMELPKDFTRKGDFEPPMAVPFTDINDNLLGVAIRHVFEDDGNLFTWDEIIRII